ncbi:NADPH:quinone reductase-like Zn-dependent oxidoreductase [Litorivivens lipolytica]|uniref:NADPH:quinone reductase-like Zn-dependent oxidoreductase n=1 Tax=Litorivivens lipolytica TaxID=1524264 RepID=A0A7W4W4G5_9GAMM|nr:medium chain dehydrogenase/reductase family protein [Litorivivens lipolytica]MBB3046978.1 NADPH:quinone reductase-like Zn-dependent oxidoreductase [Litorivivens lipolytica]
MQWKHIDLKAFGGPENMEVVTEQALPEPAPGEIRVKVLAAGTGFTDTIIRQGQYVDVKDKPPFTLGYDWFGVVDALGEGVTRFKVGDFVADMPAIGGYTQYLCVSEDRAIPCPEGLNPASAVCMILSYTTAYQMLTRECTLKPGDSILVHAAGGAVGTALLELAREMGLTVYGTASKGKHSLLEHFGATPIDYHNEDFVERITRETGGKGVNAVFDTIGGKYWSRSYRCLGKGGKLVGFGALQLTTGEEKVPSLLFGFFKLLVLWRLLPNGKDSGFYNILTRREKKPEEFKEDVATLMQWLKAGRLNPAIAAIRPLTDAAAVHRQIDKGEIAGKVVLDCQLTE